MKNAEQTKSGRHGYYEPADYHEHEIADLNENADTKKPPSEQSNGSNGTMKEWVHDSMDHIDTEHAKVSLSQAGKRTVDVVRENPVAIGLGLASITAAVWPSRLSPSAESGERALERAEEIKRSSVDATRKTYVRTKQKVGQATGAASARVSRIARQAKAKTDDVTENSMEIADKVGQTSKETLEQRIEKNPIVLCAGVFVAGLTAGLLMPRTQSENKAIGRRAERLRQKAADEGRGLVRQAREKLRDFDAHPRNVGQQTKSLVNEKADEAEVVVAEL